MGISEVFSNLYDAVREGDTAELAMSFCRAGLLNQKCSCGSGPALPSPGTSAGAEAVLSVALMDQHKSAPARTPSPPIINDRSANCRFVSPRKMLS